MPQMCPSCSTDNPDQTSTCMQCGEPLRRLLGQRIVLEGRYQVTCVLGCGGMGAVYLADDHRIPGRRVAVKENLNFSPQAQSQFQSEVSMMVGLKHPGLPEVSDQFSDGTTRRQYLVMDYVEGETLEDIASRRGPLPEKEVIALIGQLLEVLDHMHSHSVIHRDIKPANIKLKPNGKPVLVDFGIAKLHAPGHRTQTWARGLGSPGFAPIEQYGTGTDVRSDLYSLGAVMYYLLTGQVPPEAPDLAAGTSPLTPPRNLRPDVSLDVQKVVFRAMAVNPEQRFQTAAEMRQALSALEDATNHAGSASRFNGLLSAMGIPVWMAAIGGAGVVLISAALVVGTALSGTLRGTPTAISAGTRPPVVTHTLRPGDSPTAVKLAGAVTSTRTPTPSRIAEPTPTHTPKPTRTPTRTPTPTRTRQPTPTNTPVPPPPPSPTCGEQPRGEFRNVWRSYQNRLDCPHQSEPLSGSFSEQVFEGGHMFAFVDHKVIIVTFEIEGTWKLYEDKWQAGDAQESCTVSVPEGRHQPFFGFGRIWCNEPGVRDKLGWALDREYGFGPPTDLIQGFNGGVIFRDSDGYTNRRVYVLFNDNSSFVRIPY